MSWTPFCKVGQDGACAPLLTRAKLAPIANRRAGLTTCPTLSEWPTAYFYFRPKVKMALPTAMVMNCLLSER
jgi:hypothetical protein